jgi:hypothetical protein
MDSVPAGAANQLSEVFSSQMPIYAYLEVSEKDIELLDLPQLQKSDNKYTQLIKQSQQLINETNKAIDCLEISYKIIEISPESEEEIVLNPSISKNSSHSHEEQED